MGIFFDILLLALVVLTIILTARKGFAKSIVKTVAFILALILSFILTEPVTNLVYDKFLSEKFEETVVSVFENAASGTESKLNEELAGAIDSMPSFISNFIKDKGFSAEDIINAANPETANPENLAKDFCDRYVKPAALSFLNYIVALIIFIIAYFILLLILKLFATMLAGGLFGFVDKLLGGVLGLVNGAVYVAAICVVTTLLSRIVSGDFLTNMLEGSRISEFILGILPFTI